MNTKLKALLIAVSTVLGGTLVGSLVWTYTPPTGPDDRVTITMLRDAGLNDCVKRIAVTKEDLSPRLADRLRDAGAPLRPHQQHARLLRQAWLCSTVLPDAGTKTDVVIPGWRRLGGGQNENGDDEINPTGALAVRVVTCASIPSFDCAGGPNHVEFAAGEPLPCKRKQPDAGACRLASDGGDPGMWNVLPAAALTGAGCVGVECSVVAGENPDEVL